MTQTTVIWIHGANQSPLSFEYLKNRCCFDKEYFISYTSSKGFYENLKNMTEEVKDIESAFFVCHSMGGIYAVHLTEIVPTIGGVSISTPFGGSSIADWARYLVPVYPLFKDVGRRSLPIINSKKIKLTMPWTQIVTTSGCVPYHGAPNDGVVTIPSMTARDDVEYVSVDHNHYEVVVSKKVASIVNSRYYSLTNR